MNKKFKGIFFLTLLTATLSHAQTTPKVFTRADTLRGSITAERAWWDALYYDITVKPDFTNKTTDGKNIITYKVVKDNNGTAMQIDLQEPLIIDNVVFNNSQKLTFTKEGN